MNASKNLAESEGERFRSTCAKASEVLSHNTGRPTKTIHSAMNLKVQDDYSTGRSKVVPTNGWMVHDKKVFIIDECSTIDTPLLTKIHEGTLDCKIVYVGDHCQLAPVMEASSPIYNKNIPFYELTEPMPLRVRVASRGGPIRPSIVPSP